MSKRGASWQTSRRGAPFAGLGPLEVDVLVLVWDAVPQGATVRDIYEQLRTERKIAYTTVMTELGTLTRKGVLERDSSETAYRYRPAIPPRQVRGALLDELVRVFCRRQAATAVAHLLGLASLDEAQLEELRLRRRGCWRPEVPFAFPGQLGLTGIEPKVGHQQILYRIEAVGLALQALRGEQDARPEGLS